MSEEVKVWDPFVRVFHWSLVGAFTIAFLTEDHWQSVHVYAGYTVIALVVGRLLWGFVGTRHARFSDFVPAPAEIGPYLRAMLRGRPPHYLGHNPAGGAMIVALLASLLLTTLTGLLAYGAEGAGPLAAYMGVVGGDAEEAFEEVHEFFANLTLLLVGVHVTGVIVGSFLHRENLVRAMITGRKRLH